MLPDLSRLLGSQTPENLCSRLLIPMEYARTKTAWYFSQPLFFLRIHPLRQIPIIARCCCLWKSGAALKKGAAPGDVETQVTPFLSFSGQKV